ncbi:uncharacterized protein L969DRAFT_95957 [Mixia osmundae IAM 14324]|uniref:Protein phosphatase methylesterase 1 n=1 Tax=Mixia osmundae (strain CBS 9802 / IAM 14324 / JCM 22182 / KY 12970) TaxID=764103 RepID=G7DWX2_MIXOS|nr:uncharacterized protein L969DRAFT_95957 [Mixia osmundae IAM 14324]KEI38121.1 hypothetical protein L969DRAFT_95957 [Mixia osmundae IAM 14324]GAA95069.1 hypothetical protein E5Q_01724 [Mixia osmundae IAM 14324]
MSALLKGLHKQAAAPSLVPSSTNDDLEEQAELESGDTFALPVPALTRAPRQTSKQLYTPLQGSDYFAQALQVEVTGSNETTRQFRAYYTPATSLREQLTPPPKAARQVHPEIDIDPATLFNGVESPKPAKRDVLVVCHHGAGYSGLSYALFAKQLVQLSNGQLGVLSFDARGHGKTADANDLSLQSLSRDLVDLVKTLYPEREQAPDLLLVGHSMGGAVVTDACPKLQAHVANVIGLAVLDVVEGTAIEALRTMNAYLDAQPKGFASIEAAIEWHVKSRTIRNLESARVSVPALLSPSEQDPALPFSWRTDLRSTSAHWQGWFEGLSDKYLACPTPKLLVLAGTDRLDKPLMIAQMQGKYQLVVFQEAGHCLHEDAPERLATTVLDFWRRNDRTNVLAGVKKVGQ